MTSFLHGHLLMWGLIIGFGPQNLFLVSTGLRGHGIAVVVLTSFLCDVLLVLLGVTVTGQLIEGSLEMASILQNLAAHLLFLYGFLALRSSRTAGLGLREPSLTEPPSRAVLVAIGMSLANPAAWFDTLVVIGGAAQLPTGANGTANPLLFAGGALLTSLIWFSFLGFGAQYFRQILHSPGVVQRVSQLSGGILIYMAIEMWLK